MNLLNEVKKSIALGPRGTGQTHRLIEKALDAAAKHAAENQRGQVVFVCGENLVPYCRGIVKKS